MHDVDVVLDLLAEAAAWTASRGYPNWPARFSPRLIAGNARAGQLYLAEIAGEPVGTVTLLDRDPQFWGDEGDDGRAGYVHRLVVRRDHGGRGLGARLLAWSAESIRSGGRSELRLDEVTHNAPLRHYYEASGFAYAREIEGEWVAKDGTRHAWCTSPYRRPCARPGSSL